jgi:ribonucleoside-diphosphate reductase subunit M1
MVYKDTCNRKSNQ